MAQWHSLVAGMAEGLKIGVTKREVALEGRSKLTLRHVIPMCIIIIIGGQS